MRKYCLSYDAQDSSAWNANELKEKIVTVLKKCGAISFRNPAGSTLLFEDNNKESRIGYFNDILMKEFPRSSSKTAINYYLCLVAKVDAEDRHIDRIEPDKKLETDFRILLSKIK